MPSDPLHSVHTLLQVGDIEALSWDALRPEWAGESLRRAPWVVVRRGAVHSTLLPVGVRGEHRAQRCAAWLAPDGVTDAVTPQMLVAARRWRCHPRVDQIRALCALEPVLNIFEAHGFGDSWGPCGSVGFELASGLPCASKDSDLDAILSAPEPITVPEAYKLRIALGRLPVRIDVLLETPLGGVVLAEYADGNRLVMLRSSAGSRLVLDPWPASVGGLS